MQSSMGLMSVNVERLIDENKYMKKQIAKLKQEQVRMNHNIQVNRDNTIRGDEMFRKIRISKFNNDYEEKVEE